MDVLEAIYADCPDIERFSGGSGPAFLRVVVCLILRTRAVERKELMLVAKPTLVRLASCLCMRLKQVNPKEPFVQAEQQGAPGSENYANGELETIC